MASSLGGLVPVDYGSENSDAEDEEEQTAQTSFASATSSCLIPPINMTPAVVTKFDVGGMTAVAIGSKSELQFNPKYEELYAPETGPDNPFKTDQQKAKKNMLTGFVEPAHMSEFRFDNERKTFDTYVSGYARDPSAYAETAGDKYVGNVKQAIESKGASVFESVKSGGEKRKRVRNMDPTDVEGYTGPWGAFVDEQFVSKPDEKTLKEMEEFAKKRKKLKKVTKTEEGPAEEKSVLHLKEPTDYLGRSFMHPPQDVGVNLREDAVPDKCFCPKKQVHQWQAHKKQVQAIRWLPISAHLLLSASMDTTIKLWEVYRSRRLVRSYNGHRMAVRDVQFNNSGTEFLSASFDRYIKLWDTETGACKARFTTGKVPFCVKYNPDPDKQHLFLAGTQDKKVIQWDTRSGEIVQEYDRHLGSVNTITFFDGNRRFCTTSDDKSLRIWEWEIPVDTKVIQDASLHSMPALTMSPNKKWIAGQAMDNRVMLFQMIDEKIRFAKKKAFRGHMVAGYACTVDFSPDMTYLISGDADGRVFVWDWKTHKLVAKWKAHDNVCIGVLWHPHETSKIASCGWDGYVKLWD